MVGVSFPGEEPILMRALLLILAAMVVAAAPAAAQSRRGEMRGASMGPGYNRDWPAVMQSLKENGFNALFVEMGTDGAAWYPSKVLAQAEGAAAGRDELAEAVKAAKQYGIELHVSRRGWTTEGVPKDVLAKWEAEGRLMRNAGGKLVRDDPADPQKTDWLCPSNPENRKLEKDAALELVRRYDLAGLQLDFMQFPGPDYCYCDHCRAQFQKDVAVKVEQWPADVLPDGKYAKQYEKWRQNLQTSLVYDISREAHRLKPGLAISVAAPAAPDTARHSLYQDWPAWAKSGALDFVALQVYSDNPDQVAEWLRADEEAAGGAIPMYAGLGAFAMRNAAMLAQQIRVAREAGADGFIASAYDRGDLSTWLPVLHATVAAAEADPMPHWSPPARFDLSGPASLPSLTGPEVLAGAELTAGIKLGLAPAEDKLDDGEGPAQVESVLRRAADERRPIDNPQLVPVDPTGNEGYRLTGRMVMEDADGSPLAMLGGFDGNRHYAGRVTFTVPPGPFRIAIYGSEKPEGRGQPKEFVARSPLLVGVAAAKPAPQSEVPNESYSRLAQVFAEALRRAGGKELAGLTALVSVHATGEGGGDWWLRLDDGKCTSGQGEADTPDLVISAATADLLAVANRQADPMELWTAGRVAVTGDYALAKRLLAAFEAAPQEIDGKDKQ
jgi:uncharacterized lipoprotein YddW (UPF0748 family)